ncbi:hypothetical protein LptCag_2722 [Leptospirillum ferriphilum]|uniref:Uncharacterized protein n=1 Tax=Leptospirillum ferriphilum TaxID=178606 RepID=A0A094YHK8_9BACT|nr:hypothetical protein LptCag_2722 [Leptospirillum ferriphilum]
MIQKPDLHGFLLSRTTSFPSCQPCLSQCFSRFDNPGMGPLK